MSNLQVLQRSLASEGIRTQFRNALQEGAQSFAASLAELYANDGSLRECDPNLVILEAMKAASLQLPISKGLGFAYLVPFRDKNRNGAKVPQLQIGYKGYLQLAQRTGRYRYINADVVYEGEFKGKNKLTGEIDLSGEAASDKVVGYTPTTYKEMTGMEKLLEDVINTKAWELTSTNWTCDVCGQPRQTIIHLFGRQRRVRCNCHCEQAQREEEKAEEERRHKMKSLEKLQKYSLMEKRFYGSTLAAWDEEMGSRKLKKTISAAWKKPAS